MKKLFLAALVGMSLLGSVVQADYLKIRGVATGSGLNRDGKVVLPSAYDNQRPGKHIPILLDHDYSTEAAIGVVTGLFNMGDRQEYEAIIPINVKTVEIVDKIMNGVLRNTSIGFVSSSKEANLPIITKLDLMEISLVAVPKDPASVIFKAEIIKE